MPSSSSLHIAAFNALNYADEHLTPIPSASRGEFTVYRDLPDHEILPAFNEGPMEPDPSLILVDSLEELAVAFDAINTFLTDPIPSEYVEGSLEHEGHHAEASMALGFRYLQYGIRVISPSLFEYCHQAFHYCYAPEYPVTKLGWATILAMPRDPSPGDRQKIIDLGYKDLATLGKHITAYNHIQPRPLPVPHNKEAALAI